jgi:hypothetical protein
LEVFVECDLHYYTDPIIFSVVVFSIDELADGALSGRAMLCMWLGVEYLRPSGFTVSALDFHGLP